MLDFDLDRIVLTLEGFSSNTLRETKLMSINPAAEAHQNSEKLSSNMRKSRHYMVCYYIGARECCSNMFRQVLQDCCKV